MKRINTTNIFLFFIMAANLFIAVVQYFQPTRDVTLDNALGWLCALCWFSSLAIKDYKHDNK